MHQGETEPHISTNKSSTHGDRRPDGLEQTSKGGQLQFCVYARAHLSFYRADSGDTYTKYTKEVNCSTGQCLSFRSYFTVLPGLVWPFTLTSFYSILLSPTFTLWNITSDAKPVGSLDLWQALFADLQNGLHGDCNSTHLPTRLHIMS